MTRRTAPVRYRYEFSGDGVLTAARAWGPDVDLVIAASAEGKYRCRYGKTISLFDVLQQECENYAAEHPELAPLCNR